MNSKEYKNLQEAYNSIYEALTDQAELDKLRKASAQATMAGPSKEAQALMSDRTKRMLGADKLQAGIAGQERVQRMMSGTPEPTSAPKPTAPTPTSTTAPASTPKPATTVKPGDFGTTMGPGPTFKGGPVPPPIQNKTVIKSPVPDRSADYQRAWDNRNNPLAKGQIKNAWTKMSPEEKAAAKEWAKTNNKNWQEMGLPEQRDTYDQVLQILLDEGYSEQECNQIMVQLVNEAGLGDFVKAVQQRTGIGKPGVGPGQVAKNILRAGISDILGTSIATGSTPSSVSAAKPTPTVTSSPTPVVRTSTKPVRTAPKGANIAPDPWKQPSTPRSSAKPSTTTARTSTTPKALTGSPTPRALSGSQTRAALPSGTRGGALVKGTPGGAITPTAKPGALVKVQKPSTPTTTTRALPGTNVRGLLPQGVRNVLPDPWKDVTNATSGARNLWNRVQQAVKPQAQLKPSQTNVRGLLPAAKPSPQTAAKPATSVRSQQFQDVQRLNKMMKGGLMGELPSTKPVSKPAPKPTGNVDKVAPKPEKPSTKLKLPQGSGSNTFGNRKQGFSIPGGRLGAFAAGIQAYNTADATLKSSPKLPTTAKDVKKGETYYDPSTRIGPSQRFAQREKVGPKIVGPKIVGPGKVGTEAQSFDRAYKSAKQKGGMGSTFTWKGKSYKVE